RDHRSPPVGDRPLAGRDRQARVAYSRGTNARHESGHLCGWTREERGTMSTPGSMGSTPSTATGMEPATATIDSGDSRRAAELLRRITDIFGQRVVGQDGLRTALVSTLVAGGHVLLQSVPGLAKTTAA